VDEHAVEVSKCGAKARAKRGSALLWLLDWITRDIVMLAGLLMSLIQIKDRNETDLALGRVPFFNTFLLLYYINKYRP
jgi:hypothetical protein